MAAQLPHLPDVQQISTNIIRILGGNPSKFTLQGTNTYLLGPPSSRSRILLDTGEGRPAWLSHLSSALKAQPQPTTISTLLLSHWHHDHVGGVADMLNICPDAQIYKHMPTLNPDGLLDVSRVQAIHNGQTFTVDDGHFAVRALYTPGHTEDHMCFIVTASADADELGCVFSADNVLGHGTAVFEDLATYLHSLEIMKAAVLLESSAQQQQQPRRMFPGHGAVIEDSMERIEGYIAHRRMREEEALNVLRYGRTKAPGGVHTPVQGAEAAKGKEWGSMEMVKIIYADVPENLHAPAEGGLLQVLEKLRGEGKVVRIKNDDVGGAKATGEVRWKVSEKAIL